MSRRHSHLLLLRAIIRFVIVLVLFLLLLGFFGIVLFLLLALLHFVQLLPLLCKSICLGCIICQDDVIEDGASLDLPQVETEKAEIGVTVQIVVVLVFRVCNLLLLPEALVCGIRDSFDTPLALVFGIVDHWGLPLAILLVVPVVRLLGSRVYDALLLDPIIWFLALLIIHHRIVDPIFWFFVSWVWNLLRLQELPIFFQRTFVNLLLVNLHAHRVVWLQDHAVHMRCAFSF